jgi:hypothetical protein
VRGPMIGRTAGERAIVPAIATCEGASSVPYDSAIGGTFALDVTFEQAVGHLHGVPRWWKVSVGEFVVYDKRSSTSSHTSTQLPPLPL